MRAVSQDLQRRVVLLAVVFGLIGLTSSFADEAGMAPDWSLTAADGSAVRLSDEIRQQPVVVFFWATWCPYCKALMPHLQSIRLEYGDKVKILAVDFRDDGDPVAFIADAGYDFTVLPQGDEVASAYGIYGTPGIVIVDRARRIRFDLRSLPSRDPSPSDQPAGHGRRAAYLAPYWAAEIRKALDAVLAD